MVPNGFGPKKNLKCPCEKAIACPPCGKKKSSDPDFVLTSTCACA